jgi:hypothetical protein
MCSTMSHVRIMMHDVISNVPTSWTCCNLMNKVNKVQKVNNTMSLLTQFSANNNLLWGYQSREESNMIVLIQSLSANAPFTTYHLNITRANST